MAFLLRFDGVDDYAQVPSYTMPSSGVFQLELRLSNITFECRPVTINFPDDTRIQITLTSSLQVTVGYRISGTSYSSSVTLAESVVGEQVIVTSVDLDSGAIALSFNGINSTAPPTIPDTTLLKGVTSTNIEIGRAFNSFFYAFDFKSLLMKEGSSDVRLYNAEAAATGAESVIIDTVGGQDATILGATYISSSPNTVAITSIDGVNISAGTKFCFSLLGGQSTSDDFTVSGTYLDSAPSNIFIKVGDNAAKQVQSLSASDGTWSGVIALDGGMGLEVSKEGSVEVSTYPLIGCGYEYLVIGQSNASGQVGIGFTLPSELPDGAMVYTVDDSGNHEYNEAPKEDYHWQYAFSIISKHTGVPIVYTNQAVSGSNIESWDVGAVNRNLLDTNLSGAGLTALNTGRNVIWWQGEANTSMSATEYRQRLISLKDDLAASYGAEDWFIALVPKSAAGVFNGTRDAIILDEKIHLGAVTEDINLPDGVHLREPEQAEIVGARLSQTLISYYFDRYSIGVSRSEASFSSPVSLSITDAPNGTYSTELTFNGEVVYSGDVTYSGGAASVNVPLLTGASVKGYVVNDAGTNGAVIVDVTE